MGDGWLENGRDIRRAALCQVAYRSLLCALRGRLSVYSQTMNIHKQKAACMFRGEDLLVDVNQPLPFRT